VTTKAVERTAEAIGEDIAARDQAEIQRAMQLDLPIIVGKPISVLYVQVDGTGVPVVKKETVGRQGKTEGQPAHTREAKLGCVFTQTTWDKEGYAIRDPDSTTYVGAIETAEEFGKRIYLEAWNRGWPRAEKKVFMGDGSEWIWNIADQHFPGAIQIVDLFHARQHLWDLARKLCPNQDAEQRRWMMVHQDLLDEGKIEELVAALRAIDSSNPELAEKIRIEAGYFEKNRERMRYPKFRSQHLFVGTGVIEAGSTDPRCALTVTVSSLAIANTYPASATPGSVFRIGTTFTNTGQTPYFGISISVDGRNLIDDATVNGDETAS